LRRRRGWSCSIRRVRRGRRIGSFDLWHRPRIRRYRGDRAADLRENIGVPVLPAWLNRRCR
jgi:hypothetical protein